MKPVEYRSEVVRLLGLINQNLSSLIEAIEDEDADSGDIDDEENQAELELSIESLRYAFEIWDYPEKDDVYNVLTVLCAAFRDWLAATFANCERVNEQWERHRYKTSDPLKHADAIVIIRDPENPSKDVVADFCYGSSEGGRLSEKLQCLWHEPPYDWWTDNAFQT